MKLSLCLVGFIFLFPQVRLHSQFLNVFDNIDESFASTGIFWNKASMTYDPPSLDEYCYPGSAITRELLNIAHNAAVVDASCAVPSYTTIKDIMKEIQRSQSAIPIAIVELDYNYISPFAVDNQWVFVLDQELIQLPGVNIFEEGSTLFSHFEGEIDLGLNYFYLASNLYFQNIGSLPDLVEIDFDDGNGFQSVSFNTKISVIYSQAEESHNLKVRVTREAEVKKAGASIKSITCTTSFPDPYLPPWSTQILPGTENFWRISISPNDYEVAGNAYFLPTGDFDKPFIFVEGIDFNTNTSQLRNGSFGWCEFTSGINLDYYEYSMIYKMPIFLDSLQRHGYDIILLDFEYGAEKMDLNGLLLADLIERINLTKVGNEPNVVAGASMGGQVSRFALRHMERNNMDHCTRLWLTLDSPHTGANIPIGIQQILDGLSKEDNGEAARAAIEDKLMSPAARQLLRTQIFDEDGNLMGDDEWDLIFNPPYFSEWYGMMNDWGYPQVCRGVAISNGSGFGNSQSQGELEYDYFEPILSHECELWECSDGPEGLFYVMPSCGDPWYSDQYGDASNGTINISAKVVNKEKPNLLSVIPAAIPFMFGPIVGIAAAVIGENCLMTPSEHTYWVPVNTPNWDYAPGGYRNTIVEVVDGINQATQGLDLPFNLSCPIATEYNHFHSFIPTESSIGLFGLDPFDDIQNKINTGEAIVPFDRIYYPVQNQSHTTLTDVNIAFMLDEIYSGENPDGSPLVPYDFDSSLGIFNFGDEGFNYLRSVHIHDGGEILINNNQALHYGTIPQTFPGNESHFKMITWTGCVASQILISDNGKLVIGDPTGSTTAQLNVKKGSLIQLDAHGTLEVNVGSKLILESGSELQLIGGKLVIYGELIVEEGAKIIYENGTVLLPSGRLVFDGGQLQVNGGSTLELKHIANHSGIVEIMTGTENVLINGTNSKLKFTGLSEGDLILKINNSAHLQNSNFGTGEIHFNRCKVDMTDGGGIWTDMFLSAGYSSFISDGGGGNIAPWSTGAYFTNCLLSDVSLHSHWCKVTMAHSMVENTFYEAWGGGFAISNSEFDQSTIESSDLQMVSAITNTTFEYDDTAEELTDVIISDESIVEVKLTNCEITGEEDHIALYKRLGKLSLKCTVFRNCAIGVFADKGVYLNMSTSDFAGYNRFVDCDIMVYLDYAVGLDLHRGYNSFADLETAIFQGFLTGYGCESDENESCISQVISAENNIWPHNVVPHFPEIAIESEENGNCDGAMQLCYVLVEDSSPELEDVACGSKIPIIDFTKNTLVSETGTTDLIQKLVPGDNSPNGHLKDLDPGNPILNTDYFDNVLFEEALVIAASFSELIDTLGNDSISVQLFNEILTSGLDQENAEIRWKMDWGVRHMKTALENMFNTGEINVSQNETVFESSVQKYVDVLNIMTSSIVPDSVYRDRFYFEMNKGQLFHTLGNYPMALEIFDSMDDCQLDSLEQNVINYWIAVTEAAMEALIQYESGIPVDSITYMPDTTGFAIASAYDVEQYYFGAIINSPNSVTYVPCNNNRMIKWMNNVPITSVYPNPTREVFSVLYDGLEDDCVLQMMTPDGKLVYSAKKRLCEGERWTHHVPQLSTGTYIIVITNSTGTSENKIQVVK